MPPNIQILSCTHDAATIWTELPDDPVNAATAAQVAATLRGMPTRRVRRLGTLLTTWTAETDLVVAEVRVYGRVENEVLTPEAKAQWDLDMTGTVFDFWVCDLRVSSVLAEDGYARVRREGGLRRRLRVWWSRAVRWLRALVRKPRAVHNYPIQAQGRTSAALMHLATGTELAIHGRFPPGWKPSRRWLVGFALVGVGAEDVS